MKVGVFGGTFDPIHYGHLRLAEEAREYLVLDRVLFVPNQVSPFKIGRTVTPGSIRAEMVRQAIAGNDMFSLVTIEIERPGPSYTVDTLRTLKEARPADDLYFLTGADAIRDLPQWREPEKVLDLLSSFLAAARPGGSFAEIAAALPLAWQAKVMFLEMPELAISATDLRGRVGEGRSIRYLTPPAVEALIEAQGLYRSKFAAG